MCDLYERDDSRDRVPGRRVWDVCGPHLQASCHVKVAKQKESMLLINGEEDPGMRLAFNFIRATCNLLPRVLTIGSISGFI